MTTTLYWKATIFTLSISLASLLNAAGPEFSLSCNTISWQPASGAESYLVYINTQEAVPVSGTSVDCAALSIPVGQNQVQVSGVNTSGEGEKSDPFPFVILPGLPEKVQGLEVQ